MEVVGLYITRMKDHILKWLINFTTAISSVPTGVFQGTEWKKTSRIKRYILLTTKAVTQAVYGQI